MASRFSIGRSVWSRCTVMRLACVLAATATALAVAADAGGAQGWDTSVESHAKRPGTNAPEAIKPAAGKSQPPPPAGVTAAAPAMPGPLAAPAPDVPPRNVEGPAQSIAFGTWLLSCKPAGDRQTCDLSQTIRDGHNRRIVQMTVRKAGAAAYLEVIVPVGISIPYGVSIGFDNAVNMPATLADCSSDGCRAVLVLDVSTLQKFKSSTSLAVAFQDSKSGKVISISGAPGGFEQGIAMVLAAS
jgi:invasion protein IalB